MISINCNNCQVDEGIPRESTSHQGLREWYGVPSIFRGYAFINCKAITVIPELIQYHYITLIFIG